MSQFINELVQLIQAGIKLHILYIAKYSIHICVFQYIGFSLIVLVNHRLLQVTIWHITQVYHSHVPIWFAIYNHLLTTFLITFICFAVVWSLCDKAVSPYIDSQVSFDSHLMYFTYDAGNLFHIDTWYSIISFIINSGSFSYGMEWYIVCTSPLMVWINLSTSGICSPSDEMLNWMCLNSSSTHSNCWSSRMHSKLNPLVL